jgi:hypothetical protein
MIWSPPTLLKIEPAAFVPFAPWKAFIIRPVARKTIRPQDNFNTGKYYIIYLMLSNLPSSAAGLDIELSCKYVNSASTHIAGVSCSHKEVYVIGNSREFIVDSSTRKCCTTWHPHSVPQALSMLPGRSSTNPFPQTPVQPAPYRPR